MAVTGAVLVALGAYCIARPGIFISSLAWLVGFFVMISGIATLIRWWMARAILPLTWTGFVIGAVQLLLGMACLEHPTTAGNVLGIILGCGLILVGLGYFGALAGISRISRMMGEDTTSSTRIDWTDDSIDEQ